MFKTVGLNILSGLLVLGPCAEAGWFYNFCERLNIVADDPYQYMEFSIDQLVREFFASPNKALVQEMRGRLSLNISDEDREVLTKTLANWDGDL